MSGKKILLVDYDPKSLADLAKILKSNKLRVVTAADGQAGYEAFLAEKPDVVILEAMLPKLHGFDLTQKISRETRGRVPVVLITGLYKGPRYRKEALSGLGAAEYFEKPIDADVFIAAIRRLLHDDDGIDEELPDSNAVIEALSRRGRGHGHETGGAKTPHKGQRP
ncbi:MAG TPA: response regulator [Candidatus Aminicenantes bacterium]|nr:response regulator [Candidatus Aminicenantes bacterium]HDT14199.1 response regulator [Candidatus Aminicenantes bacterium]